MQQKDHDEIDELTEALSNASISTDAVSSNALVLTPQLINQDISSATIVAEIIDTAISDALPSFLTEQSSSAISADMVATEEDDDDRDFEDSVDNLSFSLGQIAFEDNKFDEAVSQLSRALDDDKDHVHAHLMLGKIHLSRSNYFDATKHLLKAGEIEPENLEIQKQIAELHLRKAKICDKEEVEDNVSRAEQAFKNILSIEPGNEEIKSTLQNFRYEHGKLPIEKTFKEKNGDIWETIIALEVHDNIKLVRAIIRDKANGQPFKAFGNEVTGKNSQKLTPFEKYKQYPTLLRVIREDYKPSIAVKIKTGKIENVDIKRYFELQQVQMVINSEFFKKFRYDFTNKIQPEASGSSTVKFSGEAYDAVAKLFYKLAPGCAKAYSNQKDHDAAYLKSVQPINDCIAAELAQMRKAARYPSPFYYKWVVGIICGTGWTLIENCYLWEDKEDSECKASMLYLTASILGCTYLSGCWISRREKASALNILDMNSSNLTLLITRDLENPISAIYSDKKVEIMKKMDILQRYVSKFETNPKESPKLLLTIRQTVELAISLRENAR